MVLYVHSGNGTDGVAVDAETPAGSDAWATLSTSGGGTMVYDDAEAFAGGASMLVSYPTSGDLAWTRWIVQDQQFASRFYLRFNGSLPGGTPTIWHLATSGSARILAVQVSSSGNVLFQNNGGTLVTMTGATLSADVWYRFEVQADLDTNEADIQFFTGNESTALDTYSTTSAATSTYTADRVHFGKYGSGTPTGSHWLDEIAYETGTTTAIGPLPLGVASYELSGYYPPNTDTQTGWQVDATSSQGTVTLTSLPGTTLTPVESPTGVFTITDDGGTSDLQYLLEASSGGASDTASITITRQAASGGGGGKYRWTFQGGDASDSANWK